MTNREAIDILRKLTPPRTSKKHFDDFMQARDMAINSLSQPEPHWIPVTERLPEDGVYVLLTVRRMGDSYNHVPFISTGYISWNHQCWWCAHDGNCKDANIDVLAWQPLPEPYKEDTK